MKMKMKIIIVMHLTHLTLKPDYYIIILLIINLYTIFF